MEVLVVADSEAATVRGVVAEVISAMVVMEVVGDTAVVIMMEAVGVMGVVIGIMTVIGDMAVGVTAVAAIMAELGLGFMDLDMVQAIMAAMAPIMGGMVVITAIRPQWLPYRHHRRFTSSKRHQSPSNITPAFGITAVTRKAIILM